MRQTIRLVAVPVAVAFLATFLLTAWPRSDPREPSLPESLRRIAAHAELSARLDDQLAQIDQQVTARRQLAEELVDGRRDLREVAARFDELNSAVPPTNAVIDRDVPGRTHGERVCRQVIQWAEEVARQRGDCAEEVTRRLEAELQCLLDELPGAL